MQNTLTTLSIWICAAVMLLFQQIFAQADISIVNPQTSGGQFSFEVHITPLNPNGLGGAPFNCLGDCSWYFNINTDALSNPSLSFVGSAVATGSGYSNNVEFAGEQLGITTDLNFPSFFGVPLTIGVNYHVYTVTLDIIDPNETAGITWDLVNTGIYNTIDQEVAYDPQGDGDVTLPVELSAFNAEAAEGKVILSWATQSEVNNLGFEVYRAQEEAGNYTMIASYESNAALQGAGNSNEEIEYQYEDASIYPGATFWYQIADVDFAGVRTFHGPIQAEALEVLPTAYALRNNYPNPFNPSTTIRFEVPANVNDRMEIVVYNALGMKLKTLVSGRVEAGVHEVVWDGTNQHGTQMASGVYFIRMAAGKFNQVQKMILLK